MIYYIISYYIILYRRSFESSRKNKASRKNEACRAYSVRECPAKASRCWQRKKMSCKGVQMLKEASRMKKKRPEWRKLQRLFKEVTELKESARPSPSKEECRYWLPSKEECRYWLLKKVAESKESARPIILYYITQKKNVVQRRPDAERSDHNEEEASRMKKERPEWRKLQWHGPKKF